MESVPVRRAMLTTASDGHCRGPLHAVSSSTTFLIMDSEPENAAATRKHEHLVRPAPDVDGARIHELQVAAVHERFLAIFCFLDEPHHPPLDVKLGAYTGESPVWLARVRSSWGLWKLRR